MVELEAKIASGYHSDKLSKDDVSSGLMQLGAIRKQCGRLYELGKSGELGFFTVDESK